MHFIYSNIYSIMRNLACLLLLLIRPADAQNFNIETFTTKNGLANDNVRSLVTDSSGYLWIATWDGISRYDGYSFKNYYHHPDDSLSLSYFSIWDILVDGGNNLWLITDQKNVAIYDRYNDIFRGIRSYYKNMPEIYSSISIDESGYLWLIHTDSIFRFDFTRKEFERYGLRDLNGSAMKIAQGGNYKISAAGNIIWLVSDKVFEFEKSTDNKLMLRNEYELISSSSYKNFDFDHAFWYRLYISQTGRKWVFSNAGLYLLDEGTGTFREYKYPFPEKEFEGDRVLYWSCHDDGIYIFNCKDRELLHLPHEYCLLIKGIYCQNSHLIWFSNSSLTGASMGFSRVILTPDYFKNYPLIVEKNDIPAVYALTKDKLGRIWVGSRGKYPVNLITPSMETINLEIPEFTDLQAPGAVRSLNVTNDGIWIGYFMELLLFYDFKTGEFTRHNPGSKYLRPITLNNKGDLYFSKDNGMIARYNPDDKKTADLSDFQPLNPIYKIVIDDDGLIWAGSNRSSLVKTDTALKKSEVFILSNDNYNVEDICIGDNDDLWLALLGGGVCNFNPGNGKKRFFTTSNGLSSNITYSLLKDKSGNIWVSTNAGISRINPKTGIIRIFGPAEGLNIIEFNSGASHSSDDGESIMGGMGGLVGFYPDSINIEETDLTDQEIMFTEIRTSGKIIPFRQSVSKSDTIILKKGENNLTIYFSSTDFIHSDKTIYRYAMSEINETWVEADSRNRNVSYANLSPGWYNFHLQATDQGGFWSAGKELIIKIEPFFYQRLLFQIAVTLVFLFLVSGFILLYIRQIRQRENQIQDALRLQSLQGQMNPHFIFNSLNSINYFISRNDQFSANKYIADFSRLIRSILYNFNSDYISFDKEIDSLEEYLKIEHLRFGDKFDYRIEVDSGLAEGQQKVSPGLVQPFVENAIWHGVRGLDRRKGMVTVNFSMQNGALKCTVEDDGIGRINSEKAKIGTEGKESRGIFIVTERLRIINKLHNTNYRIIISDLYPGKKETGTRVVIDIPVEKD